MLSKDKLHKNLQKNSLFLGEWEIDVAKTCIDGIWDFHRQGVVKGFVDSHIHLDRVNTLRDEFFPIGSNVRELANRPLKEKQDLIGYLHEGKAYTEESLKARMSRHIEKAIAQGVREMWGIVDTTIDIGSRAFEVALGLKREYKKDITLYVSCYPLFGFKDYLKNPERYNLVKELAPQADFIVGLPERDDAPDKVGFKGHISLILQEAYKNQIPVHIHVDQENSAYQRDAFRVIECIESLPPEMKAWFTAPGEPRIWFVHLISPSCYIGAEFSRLVKLMLKYNIGLDTCPTAGISMLNLRSESTPSHNCLARVVEMMSVGVPVRIGSDNVNDFLVPNGHGVILREVYMLSNAIRYYVPHVLLKVAMGIELSNSDRGTLTQMLYEYNKQYVKHNNRMVEARRVEERSFFEY